MRIGAVVLGSRRLSGALLYECLVRRVPTRSALFYLERGSTEHLGRSTEKSSASAIAPDLLEQNILGNERYVTSAAQLGTNFRGGTSTAPNMNVGAHTG